jgi:glycosyltransferase involved in cell wall biosynthesis
MRVLVLHNRYQISGGEDSCVSQETAALEMAGVNVDVMQVANDHIQGFVEQMKTALSTVYSVASRSMVAQRISAFQPDVIHVHNVFPVLTPSVYDASWSIPFVQTLHNYRTICSNAVLFREGAPCDECLGKLVPWPAVQHACYRASHAGSLAVATTIAVHSLRRTWRNRVTRFIALTDFARDIFLRNLDLRDEQVAVKPNASPDRGMGDASGGYAFYAGRLSSEKGIETLIQAAEIGLQMKLKVAGEGPMSAQVAAAAERGLLEYVGRQSREGVTTLMKQARVLLVPSLCYEGLPMVIPEAYACGLPIIASNIGALSSLIVDENTGYLVKPGDSGALAKAVERLAACPELEATMRANSRATYDRLYRPEENVQQLLAIYESAIREKARFRATSEGGRHENAIAARPGR